MVATPLQLSFLEKSGTTPVKQLRDYQTQVVEEIFDFWDFGKKSVMLGRVCKVNTRNCERRSQTH